MKENKINCQHACKNTCEALEVAVTLEEDIALLYKSVVDDCSIPGISELMNRMIEKTNNTIAELNQKLDEIKSTSGIIDDIEEKYDKD
ncbi:MAG: hypothetical protein PVF17_01740 [Ignavibacteria bacterium]|jgi:hypothetical protein